jgi:inorganic pyrophosphatase
MFDKALPIGQTFPFDFGFLPSTKGDDGDPLDILILSDDPTFVGCLVHAKLLGVIEAEQTQNGKRNATTASSQSLLKQSLRNLQRARPGIYSQVSSKG